jgi:hypothetical protein
MSVGDEPCIPALDDFSSIDFDFIIGLPESKHNQAIGWNMQSYCLFYALLICETC